MKIRFSRALAAALAFALIPAAPASAQFVVNSWTEQHWYVLIDTAGNVVMPDYMEMFRSYKNGFAAGNVGSYKATWIDLAGKRISETSYSQVSDFNADGFAMARNTSGPAIVVDRTGAEVRKVEAASSGMMRKRPPIARIMRGGPYAVTGERAVKTGLLDVNGRELVKPTYYDIGEFSEGLAQVFTSSYKAGWIDTTGKLVIPANFSTAELIGDVGNRDFRRGEFHQGRAAFSEGNLEGFINRLGEIVIKPQYTASGDFNNGFARVRLPGDTATALWAFIDTTGKQVGPTYTWAGDFHNGAAIVKTRDGRDVLVGTNMAVIPNITGPFAGVMGENGLIAVVRKDGTSYVRRDGSVAIPANKLSRYKMAGFEFTAGRTVAEIRPVGVASGPSIPLVWYEIRQSGSLNSQSRSFQVLYAIVEAPEGTRTSALEGEITNKPRNSLAVTIATGSYPHKSGNAQPDMDEIMSHSAAKPRFTKDSGGHITWIDSVDPRFLGRFKMQ